MHDCPRHLLRQPARHFLLAGVMLLHLAIASYAANASISGDHVSITARVVRHIERNQWHDAQSVAAKSGNPLLPVFVRWYMYRTTTEASFFDRLRFLQQYSDWPDRDTLILRAEESIDERVNRAVRLEWFKHFPVKTTHGRVVYAEALIGGASLKKDAPKTPDIEKGIALLREAWRSGELESDEQAVFLRKYGTILTEEDHVAAIDALMWEHRITQAETLMPLVSLPYRHLFAARTKLIRNSSGLDRAIQKVPAELQKHPGFVYERIRWRSMRGLDNGVEKLLRIVPDKVPHPDRWWPIRRKYVWKAIDEKQYRKAYALLQNHGQEEGGSLADALWLRGWLAYAYMNDPKEAYKHFYKLYHSVKFPVSLSRGAYWAARAAEKNGSAEIARRWYLLAAEHGSTFYGQLAIAKLFPVNGTIMMPKPIMIPDASFEQFKQRPMVVMTRLLIKAKANNLAKLFIQHLLEELPLDMERKMAAMLGYEMSDDYYRVRAAKDAIKFHTELPDLGYPTVRFQPKVSIERALVMAITRQESEFRNGLKSHAGAVGLMQVLPSTGKMVARRHGIRFSKSKLQRNKVYSLTIGSAYLSGLIKQYNGYYPLAIAAYNAGPGRVNRWIRELGDPRKPNMDAILWIERIPITETRNYVQRVMENLQMYRHKFTDFQAAPLQIEQDLLLH